MSSLAWQAKIAIATPIAEMRCTNSEIASASVANLPALYRAQNQENQEIPFSESKNTLFHPHLKTHLNGHFRGGSQR